MADEAIAVFTARSPQRILREGGSQAWALNAARARKAKYLICVQNQHNPDRDFSDATEKHGTAFLVAKVSDVIPCPEDPDSGRWMICFEEFSKISSPPNGPDVWQGQRNPVRYTSLADMGLNLDDLKFHPAAELREQAERPRPTASQASTSLPTDDGSVPPLTIAQAKEGLSLHYGVEPVAIEIIIRG